MLALTAWVACAACPPGAAGANGLPHVVVRGAARIEARATRSSDEVVLSGVVTDEMAAPVGGASLALTVTRESGGASVDVPLSPTTAEACGALGDQVDFPAEGGVVLPTDGRARFCVRLVLPRDRYVAHLEVRPSAFFEVARVDLPVDTSKPWGRLVVALAGLAALAWVVAARWPRRELAPGVEVPRASPAQPTGGVKVLIASPTSPGLTGRVVDAHDRVPIAGARVRLERSGFQTTTIVSQVATAPDGRFELEISRSRPGDELVVESREHCALRRPRPVQGEIEVALVLRRRELLERLVSWARHRGGRFDARPEPTPAHVRRVAGPEARVAAWADALERAAYGSAVVDEETELEVNRLAPTAPPPKGT